MPRRLCRAQRPTLHSVFLLLFVLASAVDAGVNPCEESSFQCNAGDSCPKHCAEAMFVCTGHTNTTLECSHAELFQADIGRDVGLMLVLLLLMALASAAGVGGGGIVVPLLLVLSEFPTYFSVPLSTTCVVGVTLVAFVIQVRQRHPDPAANNRTLIAYDVALLLQPGALAGTVLGVLLNNVSPNWLILSIIVIVLAYSSVKSIRKGMQVRLLERQQRDAEASTDGVNSPSKSLALAEVEKLPGVGSGIVFGEPGREAGVVTSSTIGDRGDDESHQAQSAPLPSASCAESILPDRMVGGGSVHLLLSSSGLGGDDCTDSGLPARLKMQQQRIVASEARFPWKYLAINFGYLFGLVALDLSRNLLWRCGTVPYWLQTAGAFVYLLGCEALGIWIVQRQMERRRRCNYPSVVGDLDLTGRQLFLYPFYAICVGVLAGFTGVGGGMILATMLLHLGMIPIVSGPTTNFMTLLTTFSALVQYLALERVPWDYGLLLFAVGAAASIVGQVYVVGYARRSGRSSLVVFSLAFVTVVSTVLIGVTGTMDVLEDVEAGRNLGFTAPC